MLVWWGCPLKGYVISCFLPAIPFGKGSSSFTVLVLYCSLPLDKHYEGFRTKLAECFRGSTTSDKRVKAALTVLKQKLDSEGAEDRQREDNGPPATDQYVNMTDDTSTFKTQVDLTGRRSSHGVSCPIRYVHCAKHPEWIDQVKHPGSGSNAQANIDSKNNTLVLSNHGTIGYLVLLALSYVFAEHSSSVAHGIDLRGWG